MHRRVSHAGKVAAVAAMSGALILASAKRAGFSIDSDPSAQPYPNVILITIDTLRADRLGCYGNASGLTPTMDGLARDGVLFRRAMAQVPLTLPSHTAILTGTYPMWNGVEDVPGRGLAPGLPTLAEIFKRHGYATAAFVSAFVLDSMWGLNRGFDLYDDWFKPGDGKAARRESLERRAEETVNRCTAWLESKSSRPFFLWLHLYDPHAPYSPPEPFKSRYGAHPYDGEVAYTDQQLGRLVNFLKAHKLYSSSLILLTSDHGEALGEHQEQQHGFFIYNATVRVPLILKPQDERAHMEHSVAQVVNTVGIAPTLAQLCRFPSSDLESFQGQSLLPLVEKGPRGAPRDGYSESLYARSTFGWHALRGVETEQYHYIEAPREELYDLKQDPAETRNLAGEKPAVAAALRQALQETIARYKRRGEQPVAAGRLDSEAVDKLRSLGYLSLSLTRPPLEDDPKAADPKDEIGFYNRVMRATELSEDRRFRESNALLERAAAENPTAYLVPFLQGENSLALGQPREAAVHYRRALELNPGFDQAAMGLGHAAFRAGENAEAEKAYQLALILNPANYIVRLALARVYAQLNQFEAAAREQRQALQAHPHFAPAQADYGVTMVRLKKYDEALSALLRAVELGDKTPRTYCFLGNAYLPLGKPSEAIRAYKQAIRLDPNYGPAYVNLALYYVQSGQPDKAGPYYQKGCRLDPQLCRQLDSRFR